MPQLQVDTTSEFPQMLLVISLGGSEYYFAERGPVTITVDGVDVMFSPGLVSQTIEQSIDLWNTSASSRSVSVQVDLGNLVCVRTLLAGGIALYATEASLYLYAGGTFEEAQRVASGFVKDPIYADPTSPKVLGFTIERDFVERALFPPSRAFMDETSFDGLPGGPDDDDIGLMYPVPIGKPGKTGATLAGVYKAMQAVRGNIDVVLATNARIVVAYGHLIATHARVWSNNNTSEEVGLVNDIDENDVPVTYLDLTTAVTHTDYSDPGTGPTYVAFDEETTAGLEARGFDGLGDVVIWMLEQSSLNKRGGIDWKRVNGNRDKLNRLGRVDTWLATRIRPLDWLINDVLTYFPVFVSDVGDGLYVDAWDYDASASQVELVINTDIPGFERISPVSWSSSQVYNDITIKGGPSAASGEYIAQKRWSGDPEVLGESQQTLAFDGRAIRAHKLLTQSWEMFDTNEVEVAIPTVVDSETLDKLGNYYVYKYALPRQEVGYSVPWRKVIPRPGMVVSVNDPDAGLNGAVGLLSGYRYVGGALQVRVAILTR